MPAVYFKHSNCIELKEKRGLDWMEKPAHSLQLCNVQNNGLLAQHKMPLQVCVWLSNLISSAPVIADYVRGVITALSIQ